MERYPFPTSGWAGGGGVTGLLFPTVPQWVSLFVPMGLLLNLLFCSAIPAFLILGHLGQWNLLCWFLSQNPLLPCLGLVAFQLSSLGHFVLSRLSSPDPSLHLLEDAWLDSDADLQHVPRRLQLAWKAAQGGLCRSHLLH